MATKKRQAISKKVRFEVFKRDAFKCQYCGAAAPEVVLHVDHIKPVKGGGGNEIANLITSCAGCNFGKGNVPLADGSAVEKQRAQLEDLQQQREQLAMMMEWGRGLRSIADATTAEMEKYWQETTGYGLTDCGRATLAKWVRKYSVEELMRGMNVAADHYMKRDEKGVVIPDSCNVAFNMTPRICNVRRAEKDCPDIQQLLYIRAIARNRCSYFLDHEALTALKQAREAGVSVATMKSEVERYVRTWNQFRDLIATLIDEARASREATHE